MVTTTCLAKLKGSVLNVKKVWDYFLRYYFCSTPMKQQMFLLVVFRVTSEYVESQGLSMNFIPTRNISKQNSKSESFKIPLKLHDYPATLTKMWLHAHEGKQNSFMISLYTDPAASERQRSSASAWLCGCRRNGRLTNPIFNRFFFFTRSRVQQENDRRLWE